MKTRNSGRRIIVTFFALAFAVCEATAQQEAASMPANGVSVEHGRVVMTMSWFSRKWSVVDFS